MAHGCDDFLPKPFRESELIAKLGAALALEWIEEPTPLRPARADNDIQIGEADLRAMLEWARDGQIVPLRERLDALAQNASGPLLTELAALARSFQLARLAHVLEKALSGGSMHHD
jgi:hypothetical protein